MTTVRTRHWLLWFAGTSQLGLAQMASRRGLVFPREIERSDDYRKL